MAEELKPCPLCGQKVSVVWDRHDGMWHVDCNNHCGYHLEFVTERELMVKRHNTRPRESKLEEALAVAEKALKRNCKYQWQGMCLSEKGKNRHCDLQKEYCKALQKIRQLNQKIIQKSLDKR